MPSKKHEAIKKMLNIAANSLKNSDSLPHLQHMRYLIELGTFFYLLPWDVHIKKVMVNNKIYGEVVIPATSDRKKVMLYFHGGGYIIGSSHSHRSLVGKIAKKAGVIALLIEYRKAPEHPFPAALEDAFAGYKYLIYERGKLPEDIVFAGDSAGGGLVFATLLKIKEEGLPMPAGAIGVSPWVDLTNSGDTILKNRHEDPLIDPKKMEKCAKMYSGAYDVTNPFISPLFGDLSGLPPCLIQASDSEMLYCDAVRFVKKAKEAGVDVTFQTWGGLIHWWQIFQWGIPEAGEALDKISDFIQFTLKSAPLK
jgi:acetyl esterase/lipase